jgi:hypothetical protein
MVSLTSGRVYARAAPGSNITSTIVFEVKTQILAIGDHMKTRICLLTLAVLFTSVVACFAAQDVSIGTWKLNEAKSKIGAGATKNTDVVYTVAGDNVKVTVEGVTSDGKPVHSEWTGKLDGKDYPVTGDPANDARAYGRVDDHTLTITNKKDGKVTQSGRAVVSADGKRRTVTISGTDAKGKKISSTSVYDKQ